MLGTSVCTIYVCFFVYTNIIKRIFLFVVCLICIGSDLYWTDLDEIWHIDSIYPKNVCSSFGVALIEFYAEEVACDQLLSNK